MLAMGKRKRKCKCFNRILQMAGIIGQKNTYGIKHKYITMLMEGNDYLFFHSEGAVA